MIPEYTLQLEYHKGNTVIISINDIGTVGELQYHDPFWVVENIRFRAEEVKYIKFSLHNKPDIIVL